VCPQETIRTVFDHLPGIKSFVVYPTFTPHCLTRRRLTSTECPGNG
jgi:hypothetical protein